MTRTISKASWTALAAGAVILAPALLTDAAAAQPSTNTSDSPLAPPPNGPRRVTPDHHILFGVMLHARPGERPYRAMIEIRDGRILAARPVFENEDAPTEEDTPARIHVLEGEHVYAAFIDPFVEVETPRQEDMRGRHWNDGVTPRRNVLDGDGLPESARDKHRKMGFGAAGILPDGGFFAGTGAVISLVEQPEDESARIDDVYRDQTFQAVNMQSRGFSGYPSSDIGLVALLRQTLLDATWQGHFYQGPSNALTPLENRDTPLIFDVDHELEILLADEIAEETDRKAIHVGNGRSYKWIDAIADADDPIIVPLAFADAPDLDSQAAIEDADLEAMLDWEHSPSNAARLLDAGVEIALTATKLPRGQNFTKNLQKAVRSGLAEDDALAALTTVPARMLGVASEIGMVDSGMRANLIVASGPIFDAETKIYDMWIDGRPHDINDRPGDDDDANEAGDEADNTEIAENESTDEDPNLDQPFTMPELPGYPFGAYAMDEPPAQFDHLILTNATIWTQGPKGVIENGQLEIKQGTITYVGDSRNTPRNATVLDMEGKHITPGLIDAHSHSGLGFGVNEGGQAVSAEVRIADSLHSDNIAFYRQLAGGVTAINSLHGSSNPIGGQSQTHKLRWGVTDPTMMRLEGAKPGIKFALGENVKRSRASRQTRYPATRMGVETIIRDRFIAAREYLEAWNNFYDEYNLEAADLPEPIKAPAGDMSMVEYYDQIADAIGSGVLPPRRNLELEALAEIIKGDRLVHCHSYRQDEILMLARVAEEFGFTIGSYQHGLEVYKVVEIVEPFTFGASIFADWWGYKFEVFDAIPYDGSLMNEVGLSVSYNSDSADLARRLNLEAAKGVKYSIDDKQGNRMTTDEEALAFVTINAAKQLGVDDRIGSLEQGKDADFTVWSEHPLSTLALTEHTFIDGREYFSLQRDDAHRERIAAERERLIEKIKADGPSGNKKGKGKRGNDRTRDVADADPR